MTELVRMEIMWTAFWVIVLAALAVDIILMSKHKGAVSLKEASLMVCGWITLATAFGIGVYFMLGKDLALEYITGYILEYSLSIDNMFVFIMIFTYFATPPENQPKILIWGVLGAIVLRFLFVFIGVQLISKFEWTIYVFGAILLFTSIKMLTQKEEMDPGKNIAFRAMKKFVPFNPDYKGRDFFIKEAGKWVATPVFATVLVIEMSDVIFAVDSIPAILSITQNTLIVFSSNIFAILGLRALYFMLAGIADKFAYLKYGISAILFFVGVKMIIHSLYKIPTEASLGFIVGVIALSIFASKIWPPKKESEPSA